MSDVKQDVLSMMPRLKAPPGYEFPGGVSDFELRGFEERTGLLLPEELRDWLRTCNGALIGPGGVYGIRPREAWLDIESMLADFPEWQRSGWVPVAGDGNGDYYVMATRASSEAAGVVMFIEPMTSTDRPTFVVASDIWHFLSGLFSAELGERSWPFDERSTLDADPRLAEHASLGLPWER